MGKCRNILTAICLIDLTITIVLINSGLAQEWNPILGWYFEQWGIWGLSLAKIWINSMALLVLELSWRFNLVPLERMKRYYIFCIIAYILCFFGPVVVIHLSIIPCSILRGLFLPKLLLWRRIGR